MLLQNCLCFDVMVSREGSKVLFIVRVFILKGGKKSSMVMKTEKIAVLPRCVGLPGVIENCLSLPWFHCRVLRR